MRYRSIHAAILSLLVTGIPIAATFHEEVDCSPGDELAIDLGTGGSLNIVAWGQNRLSVHVDHGDNVVFHVERGASKVEITSEFVRGDGRHHSTVGEVEIRVPDRLDVRVETTGGRIRVEGIDGTLEGETMGGELILLDLRGELDLTTMGGNIELRRADVTGKLKTYGGNVHLEEVRGTVEAHTMGGNVVYDNVDPTGGEVRVTTMGGNIRVPRAPHGADVETMGGNIRVDSAGEYVKAKTMGGNIRIGSVEGWVKAQTMGGDVEVTLVGDPRGRRDVRLSSKGGDVTLTLPDGLSMEVDITLAYTRGGAQDYRIISDFPLNIKKSDDWEYGQGSPRKYIRGAATINGGERKIKIDTINGDVRLIKD